MLKAALGVVQNARENTWVGFPHPSVAFTVHLGTEDSQEATKLQLYQVRNWRPGHQGPIFNSTPSQLWV